MDWSWEGDESDEESKLRAETRKILELPDLPDLGDVRSRPGDGGSLRGRVGRAPAATEPGRGGRDPARRAQRPRARSAGVPDAGRRSGRGRGARRPHRPDTAAENGVALYLSSDNLRKGAALNAIQIAELLLSAKRDSAEAESRGSLPGFAGAHP